MFKNEIHQQDDLDDYIDKLIYQFGKLLSNFCMFIILILCLYYYYLVFYYSGLIFIALLMFLLKMYHLNTVNYDENNLIGTDVEYTTLLGK
jgi:hypothetical protein